MMRERTIPAAIVIANLTLSILIYQTVGWYFIRGYNEVVTFAVIPFVLAQAGLNLLVAAAIAFVHTWRRTPGGRMILSSLCSSAVIVALSLLLAPFIGSVAKRNLWIETPFIEAARYGDAELVIGMVKTGANLNERHPALDTTALHYMAAGGELDAVEALLANGADVNAKAEPSMVTPLHWAVRHRTNAMTIKLLMKHGADPTLKDWHGKTPAEYTRIIPDPLRSDMLNAMERRTK